MTRMVIARQRAARQPVADMIRDARKAKGLTQEDLAEACGKNSPETVSQWERCDRLPPKEIAIDLCVALGLPRPDYYRVYRRAVLDEIDATLDHLRPPGVNPRD